MGQLIAIEKWAANLEEVTVNRWLHQEGERVAEGDSLCEIITEKVTFEYEVEQSGVLRRIYCQAGSIVPVGYIIAFIGKPDEPLPADVLERNVRLMQEYRSAAQLDLEADIAQLQSASSPSVRATPAARRLARQEGVDLAQIAQRIEQSRAIREDDVSQYLQQRTADSDE